MKLIFYKDGALGDIAVLIPLFLQLREQFSAVSLTLITNEGFLSPFLEKSGIIDFRISSGTGDIYKIFSESGESEYLKTLSCDRIFFMTRSVSKAFKKPENSIIASLPTSSWSEFVAFYYIQEVFARLGTESLAWEWRDVRNRSESAVKALGIEKNEAKERIIFHPGSGSEKKNLKSSAFCNVLDSIQSEKHQKTLILGPAEMDRLDKSITTQYQERVDETFISPDIETLITLLLNSKFYFGMDSGVTHVANLFAENVISFWNTSQPNLWSPKFTNIHVVKLSKDNFN